MTLENQIKKLKIVEFNCFKYLYWDKNDWK
jgi:hypothetical protein